MSAGINLSPAVLAARRSMAEGREKLRHQHDQDSPGIQVCAKLTDLADKVVIKLFEAACSDAAKNGTADARDHDKVALIAHGGYGRRELAPFSDIDLMFLYANSAGRGVEQVAARLLRDIFDAGLHLGHSVRSTSEAVSLACQDAQILTSLSESRFVAGNEELAERYLQRLKSTVFRRRQSFIPLIEQARRDERHQYGETVYLLEPNIKRSRGGLRDMQLLRWLGFCCYGRTDLDGLFLCGALEKDEQQQLLAATEFLLRIRNDVHFHAGKAQDQLDRIEQLRLAERFGYKGRDGLRPVEEFMRDYFRHTQSVRFISGRFLSNVQSRSRVSGFVSVLLSHSVERDYRVTPYHICATKRGLKKLREDLGELLRLAELSTLYNKRISHKTWEVVRHAVASYDNEITPDQAQRFMAVLSRPPQLARLLGRLHQLGALEKFIPAFSRARGLLQFNQYHKYTVDEHCLRAVAKATEFASDFGPIGRVYAAIQDKQVLHLALLLHDLGKGYPEDHCEVGRQLAAEIASRLRLPLHQAEMLEFLVHKHLLMTHLALWRDISDPAVSLQFALDVGSPEVLQMLFVMSAADLAAVGPDVLTDWKTELLTRLYYQTLTHLTGETVDREAGSYLQGSRSAVRAAVADESDQTWYEEQIAALPAQYLTGTTTECIAETLHKIYGLPRDEVLAWSTYHEDSGTVEFTVGAYEGIAPGIFHRLTGALSGQGVEILSAQINTLHGGLILDRFHVLDPDFPEGQPSPERIACICQKLVNALKVGEAGPPKFRRRWGTDSDKTAHLSALPTRVLYDNVNSERATILEIFAADCTGLLYTVTRKLFELGLSVTTAKIGTYVDQVVDVFYVTGADGKKIQDEGQLESIRKNLLATIESFLQQSREESS